MSISSLSFVAKQFSQEETGKLLRGAGFETDEKLTRIAIMRHCHKDNWERILRGLSIPPLRQSSHQSTYWENWNTSTYGETALKIRAPRSTWEKIRRLSQFIRAEHIPDISQPAMARGNDFAPLEIKEVKARQRAKIEKRYRFAPLPTDAIRETGKEDETAIALQWYMTIKDTLLAKNGIPIGTIIDAMERSGADNDTLISHIVKLWEGKGKPDTRDSFRKRETEKAPPVSNRAPRIKRKRKVKQSPYDVIAHWQDMFPDNVEYVSTIAHNIRVEWSGKNTVSLTTIG